MYIIRRVIIVKEHHVKSSVLGTFVPLCRLGGGQGTILGNRVASISLGMGDDAKVVIVQYTQKRNTGGHSEPAEELFIVQSNPRLSFTQSLLPAPNYLHARAPHLSALWPPPTLPSHFKRTYRRIKKSSRVRRSYFRIEMLTRTRITIMGYWSRGRFQTVLHI